MKFFLLFSFGFFISTIGLAAVINIADYGAKSDGQTVNTIVIQKAIDDCTRAGGGEVLIPSGVFVSGTLFLKSNTSLHLQAGAVLKGSDRLEDYRVNGFLYGLIFGEDIENASITGPGEINGNGIHFMDPNQRTTFIDYDPKLTRQGEKFMNNYEGIADGPINAKERPDMMIFIRHSSNIMLDGITLTDAPNWTIRIAECENVRIIKLEILNNRLIPNNDGIHCTTSRNVIISDCNISAGDDGIIVTGFGDESGTGGYTEKISDRKFRFGNHTHEAQNITVSNCIIASSSAAIRIGYGMNNINNCVFTNLIFYNSNRGILIQCRDNNTIEHLSFSHILMDTRLFAGAWWGKAEPIHISAMPQNGTKIVGRIRDIHFEDILVKHAEAGILLYGLDEKSSIDDIRFTNVRLILGAGLQSGNFGGNIDLRPVDKYSYALFKRTLPAVFGHNVKNISLQNVSVEWEAGTPEFFSSSLEFENFNGITITAFTGTQAGPSGNVIYLKNGSGVRIMQSVAAGGSDIFCHAVNCKNIWLSTDNDLKSAKQKLLMEK